MIILNIDIHKYKFPGLQDSWVNCYPILVGSSLLLIQEHIVGVQ